MKRFVSLIILTLQMSSLIIAPTPAFAQVVAPANATFIADDPAQIQAVQQGYYNYMNPPVAATPVDPSVLAAQQAAAEAAAAQKRAQNAAMIQAGVQACSALFGGGNTISQAQRTANEAVEITSAAYDEQGFQYAPGYNQPALRAMGASGSTRFAGSCENFMNKEGKMKGWGFTALEGIKRHPASFGEKVPSDIARWCPNYAKFSKEERDLYWVWTLTSMASSESSCNPGANNTSAPNGTAYGLLQVEPKICPKADNLAVPTQNITCAVDRLADELDGRANLMTGTSSSPDRNRNTYWGPLRCDDYNRRRGGDIVGSLKTRCLMTQYTKCGMPERKCNFATNYEAYRNLADLKINCPR